MNKSTPHKKWGNIFKSWRLSKLPQKEYCKKAVISYSLFKRMRYEKKHATKILDNSGSMNPIKLLIENERLQSGLTLHLSSKASLSLPADMDVRDLKSFLHELGLL